MSFANRSYDKELLDKDNIPFPDIVATMRELNIINTLLGGHKITKCGVSIFLKNTAPVQSLTIAEIGCGGGDNLTAIHNFLKSRLPAVHLVGIDIKQECITFAKQHSSTNTQWICGDYKSITWADDKPDILFSSLFCHHFTNDELVAQLQWMKTNSKIGFFINDLHRHPLAYYFISILTKLFSRSYLVKNDAPLSVKRAFKQKEWEHLLSAAGITRYSISWKWAFRYLICVRNE